MKNNRKPKVGDILEIPINQNKRTYAHFVYQDKQNGDLVLPKKLLLENSEQFNKNDFNKAPQLFRPVITSVSAAVSHFDWKIVDSLPLEQFEYPGFLHGAPDYWMLWDGEKYIDLGEEIPEQYKDYEELACYSPDLITKRIENLFQLQNDSTEKSDLNDTQQPTFLDTYMFYGDFAADYVYTLEDNPTTDHIEKTLQKVASTAVYEYLESPDASEALVAAEAVAFLRGKPSEEATASFTEAMDKFKTPDTTELKYLEDQAVRAVKRILYKESELLDLWKESDEFTKWKNAATNLLARLVKDKNIQK